MSESLGIKAISCVLIHRIVSVVWLICVLALRTMRANPFLRTIYFCAVTNFIGQLRRDANTDMCVTNHTLLLCGCFIMIFLGILSLNFLTAAWGWYAITKPRFFSSKRILTTRENLRCSRPGYIRANKSSSILNFLGTHISMPIIVSL
jgi:hypothetical protein